MKVDVVPLPRMLTDEHVRDRAVVVFDVLRASTTIAAALAAGAKEIRVFCSLDAAPAAASKYSEPMLFFGGSKWPPPEEVHFWKKPRADALTFVFGESL